MIFSINSAPLSRLIPVSIVMSEPAPRQTLIHNKVAVALIKLVMFGTILLIEPILAYVLGELAPRADPSPASWSLGPTLASGIINIHSLYVVC